MQKISLLSLALFCAIAPALSAHAQAPTPAPAPAPAAAQSSPAKKELVARILKLQQPGIEGMARQLAEQPAAEMMEKAAGALSTRIAADRREAVGKEIQADVKKYLDETAPMVQARAVRLAPTTIGTLLEEKFTEDELRQVLATIESPVYNKFQQLGGDMQKVLVEKLVTDTRAAVEPKVKALELAIIKRLGGNDAAPASGPAAAPAPGAARPPSRPASR